MQEAAKVRIENQGTWIGKLRRLGLALHLKYYIHLLPSLFLVLTSNVSKSHLHENI